MEYYYKGKEFYIEKEQWVSALVNVKDHRHLDFLVLLDPSFRFSHVSVQIGSYFGFFYNSLILYSREN